MHDELKRSEERYALVMAASDEGYWDWMVASDEFYASPRLLEMYGFPPGTTFAGRDDFLARFPLHPEDRLTWQESVAAHFTGKTARFDKELRTLRDGETRWLHLTGLATRDASGKVVRWTGSTTDITERKRAEEALRLAEERYAFAMEAAQDAHWDWIVGTDEYYTSPRVVDVFGLPPGTTFTSRLDYLAKTPLLKKDLEVWLRAARELFAGTGSRLSMELRARVGGEIRWIQHNGVGLRDGTGRPVRWCGSVRDVTERRRTEEALRLSEERYALAGIGAKDGIWDRDLTTGMLYLSPRAQEISMGRPAAGVDVRHDAEWRKWHQIHPEDASRREGAMREHLKGRTPQWEGEWRVRHQDGSYHWVHARGICTRDASGRAVRFAGSVTDIDARKCAEHELKLSEERHALAMTAADEGYWDWIVDTDEFYCSPRLLEMYGFPPGTTFAGRGDFLARFPLHPEDRLTGQEGVAEHFAGKTARFEKELRTLRDGETHWLQLTGLATRNTSGRVVRWAGATKDITARKQAEQALRLSEERYALAMQASGEGHWDWKIASDEYYTSPRHLEIAGFPPGTKFSGRAEVVERVPFHPEDRPRYEAAVAAHFAGKTPRVDIEMRLVRPNELRSVRLLGICLRDATGTPVRWPGSLSDT